MTWFKVDDGLHSHRKVLSIPRKDRAAAMGLWVLAGAWCSDNLTDGRVPMYMVSELGASPRHAEALVTAGLWDRMENGSGSDLRGSRSFAFHDWHQSNPTRDQVEEQRDAARERMRRLRSGEHPPNNARTSGEVQPLVRDPRPVPSRPSSGLGSQSALGSSTRADGKTTDQPDLDKIAAELGQDTAWARRVVNDVLSRTSRPPGDVTAYVLAALRTEPQRYQRTPGPPPISRLCDHGRDRLTCVDCEDQP